MLAGAKNFMELAPHKCERPSAENMSEFIAKLCQLDDTSREWMFNNILSALTEFTNYMNGKDTMAKVYLLQTLQNLLSTSEQSKQKVFVS